MTFGDATVVCPDGQFEDCCIMTVMMGLELREIQEVD